MNWTNEKQKLETQTAERPQHPWFNPEIGQTYQVTITEDVDESNYYENVYNGEKRKKLRVPIKVEDKEQNWGISVGKTPSSLYGQLIYLFEHWQSLNHLIKNQVIHLEVTAQDDLAAKRSASSESERPLH